MEFDDTIPLKRNNRGPTIDTVDLELDDKQNFFEKVHQQVEKTDSLDRKAYHKLLNQKKLVAKIKRKRYNRMKSQGAKPPTIDNPVDEEDDYEGKEHYSEDEAQLNSTNDENNDNNNNQPTTRKRLHSFPNKYSGSKKYRKKII